MSNNMGGSSTAKVPAWKLRQQARQNVRVPAAPTVNDELGGTRLRPSRPRGAVADELGGTTKQSSGAIPAWKLREKYKQGRGDNNDFDDGSSVVSMGSTRSNYSRASLTSHSRRTVSRVPDDPNLPPAFRTALSKQQQRKRNPDDFHSLSSVHSRSRTGDTNSVGSFSFEFLDSDSNSNDDDSFDGEDSFASLDSDANEDDDAYRESRNQMARLEIEKQKQSQDSKRVGKSRFKKQTMGVHGTPLDFIAE